MSQSRKRKRKGTAQLLAAFQKALHASSQWLPLFQPQIQQLLLCQQEWSLDKEEEEQVIVTGLMPASLSCSIYSSEKKGRLLFTLDGSFPDIKKVQPPTLRDCASLSLIKLALRNSYEQLHRFQRLVAEMIVAQPQSPSLDAEDQEEAVRFVNEEMMCLESLQDMVPNSEEYQKMVCKVKIHMRECRIPAIMSKATRKFCGGDTYKLRNQYKSEDIQQTLAAFPSQLSPLSPLLHTSASHLQLRSATVLVKISVVLYYEPTADSWGLTLRLTPLTPSEHTLLQKQPRFDGQLPCVLPYGCILC